MLQNSVKDRHRTVTGLFASSYKLHLFLYICHTYWKAASDRIYNTTEIQPCVHEPYRAKITYSHRMAYMYSLSDHHRHRNLNLSPCTLSLSLSLSHTHFGAPAHSRRTHARANDPFDIICIYASAEKCIYVLYVHILLLKIRLATLSPTHIIHVHAPFYPPSPSSEHGRRSFIYDIHTPMPPIYIEPLSISQYIICDIHVYHIYIYTYYSGYTYTCILYM